MKNKLFKIFTTLAIVFTIIGCGNVKKVTKKDTNFGVARVMLYEYNMGITNHQLDSICRVDTLSYDFNDWINTNFIDYTTRDTIRKHMFIKKIDGNNEIIYVVTEWRDSLAISKRITKK